MFPIDFKIKTELLCLAPKGFSGSSCLTSLALFATISHLPPPPLSFSIYWSLYWKPTPHPVFPGQLLLIILYAAQLSPCWLGLSPSSEIPQAPNGPPQQPPSCCFPHGLWDPWRSRQPLLFFRSLVSNTGTDTQHVFRKRFVESISVHKWEC